jgi:hypothetical protein
MSFLQISTVLTVIGISFLKLLPASLPRALSLSQILIAWATFLLAHAVYSIVFAPLFSSFSDLPQAPQKPWYKRLLKEPTIDETLGWINDVPNDGNLHLALPVPGNAVGSEGFLVQLQSVQRAKCIALFPRHVQNQRKARLHSSILTLFQQTEIERDGTLIQPLGLARAG